MSDKEKIKEEHNVDLKEEIEHYLDFAELKAKCKGISAAQDYFDDITKTAYHFAEWQREKDIRLEKIDDLEEFAQKWAYSNYHQEMDGVNCDCLYSGVKKGAEWSDSHPKQGLWDSEKVISFIKESVREYHKSGVFHVDDFINNLSKSMED